MKRFLSLTLSVALLLSLMATGLFRITVSAETTGRYTITYHLDGGTNAIKNPDVYTAQDTITLMPATKVGYDFAGWFLDAKMTEQISEISNTSGNLVLYANFVPKRYTSIFDDNGATQSSQLTITLDDSIGTTKEWQINNGDSVDPYSYWIPRRDGHVFAGWYYDEQLVSETLYITSNITLTAKWESCNQYGSRENPIILGENSKRIFYSGGFYSEKISYSSGNSTEPLRQEDLYSKNGGWYYTYVYVSGEYSEIKYEASCGATADGYAEGLCEIYDVTNQKELVEFPPFYCAWNTYTGSIEVQPGTLLKIGIGYWMRTGYSPRFGKISISLGESRKCKILSTNERTIAQEFDAIVNVPAVSREGYTFGGWYDTQGNKMTDTWQYTEDQEFTAKWNPTKYYITYELNGATNSGANPLTYTIEDSITLSDPYKPGYTFKGWYSDAHFQTQVTSISNNTGNITLYAKWEVNNYNLTLDANTGVFAPKVTFVSGGVEIKSCYLYEQDTITAYRPTGKDNYIFAGWYTDDTFTSLFKFNGTISNDITLYAKWVECNSNIINIESAEKFNTTIQGKTEQLYAFVPLADGKITITSESNNLDLYGILYDTSKNVLISADDISSTDLDFSYSYNVTAGQLYYISVKGNTASTTGQAVVNISWTGNCTVTGTTYQNRQLIVTYDTDYKLPQKPVREGYVFLGWFDENNTQITEGTWNFVTDKTLTAKWEEATYHTVVFKDLAGNVISSETYYLSEDIIAPELPTKAADETYTYHAKWDNDYMGVCTGDAVYSPTFDKEYIEYTITFQYEDGTVIKQYTVHYGDSVVPPADPASPNALGDNYEFSGWDKEITDCQGNAVYTAVFARKYISGDLTGDGKINSLDGLLLMRYLNGWDVNISAPEAMDVNGDGKVNSLDGLILMRYLNGWNVTLG